MTKSSLLASAFLTTVMIARSLSAADGGLYLIVTPERDRAGGSVGCRVQPESEPPMLTNDAVRLLVTVEGTSSPVRWRMPLYRTTNGSNELAVARVGEGTPDKAHQFVIRVTAADLGATEDLDELRVELRTKDGREVACSVKAAPLRIAARQPGLVEGLSVKAGVDR